MSERKVPVGPPEGVEPYAFTALYGSALAFLVGMALGEGRIVFLAIAVVLVTVVGASRGAPFETVRVCLSWMADMLGSLLTGTDKFLDLAVELLRFAFLLFLAYCLYASYFG